PGPRPARPPRGWGKPKSGVVGESFDISIAGEPPAVRPRVGTASVGKHHAKSVDVTSPGPTYAASTRGLTAGGSPKNYFFASFSAVSTSFSIALSSTSLPGEPSHLCRMTPFWSITYSVGQPLTFHSSEIGPPVPWGPFQN